MAGRAARPRTPDARGAQEPLHRLSGDVHAFTLDQQFGELVIVDPSVGAPRQGDDLGTERLRQLAWRGAAAVAVGEGGGALPFQASAKAAEMPR
jgi:hypothetical protein